MSAKGRKRAEVADFEFYPTPRDTIEMLISSSIVDLPGGIWIDPCVGSGRIPSVVNSLRDDVRWILADIDERHEPAIRSVTRHGDEVLPFGDFVTIPWELPRAEVLIMNPPFSHALSFVTAAMERAHNVVMLQRLNWLAPARAEWLRVHMPDTYVLPRRPSFTGDGQTDSVEYAWFIWPLGNFANRTGRVAMLDATPRQLTIGGVA